MGCVYFTYIEKDVDMIAAYVAIGTLPDKEGLIDSKKFIKEDFTTTIDIEVDLGYRLGRFRQYKIRRL